MTKTSVFCSQPTTPTPPMSPKYTIKEHQLTVEADILTNQLEDAEYKIRLLTERLDLYKFFEKSLQKETMLKDDIINNLRLDKQELKSGYEAHYKRWRKQTKRMIKRYNIINKRYHAYRKSYYNLYYQNNDSDDEMPDKIKQIRDEEHTITSESALSDEDDTLEV